MSTVPGMGHDDKGLKVQFLVSMIMSHVYLLRNLGAHIKLRGNCGMKY